MLAYQVATITTVKPIDITFWFKQDHSGGKRWSFRQMPIGRHQKTFEIQPRNERLGLWKVTTGQNPENGITNETIWVIFT